MTIEVFPRLPGQVFWASKGPSWTTTVKKAASGRQIRGSQQGQPIWKFKVGYQFLRDDVSYQEIEQLFAFFNNCCGQLNPFYLLDPYDSFAGVRNAAGQVTEPQQVAVGDGTTTTFQLTRTIGAGSPNPFVEPVYGVVHPLGGSDPLILVNGEPATGISLGPLGTISFQTAPAPNAVISWSGSFYFLCHFAQDELSPVQMMSDLWSSDGVAFESLIP